MLAPRPAGWRRPRRRRRSRSTSPVLVAGLVLPGLLGLLGILGPRTLGPASGAVPPSVAPSPSLPPAIAPPPSATGVGAGDGVRGHGPLGRADGLLPDGASVVDSHLPGVANLDPALLGALRQADAAAARHGIRLVLNSGWRSRAYQEELLDRAVARYGSRGEAARWVATPDTSAHVSGDAVDLGPPKAATWLAAHGSRYGLCRTYANEPWHFELHPDAAAEGCPHPYPDPTQDPRMRAATAPR